MGLKKSLTSLFNKKALIVGLALLFGAAALEFEGYSPLDTKDGNIACRIDPSCRHLTDGEVALARPVFGGQIDYSRVKVFNRSYFGLGVFKWVHNRMAPNGNIYVAEGGGWFADFSADDCTDRPQFMHEMMHVAQYQQGRPVKMEAVWLMLRHRFDYDRAYSYAADADKGFEKLGIEQQAEMVLDYQIERDLLRQKIKNAQGPYGRVFTQAAISAVERDCEHAAKIERRLASGLPVKADPACANPRALVRDPILPQSRLNQ